MFGWLRKRAARPQPEARWIVECADEAIRVVDDRGEVRSLAKEALTGIVIETNDSGPWGTDLWWLLLGADERVACIFPQGATGENHVLDYLMALPGFDLPRMALAMGSTDNATFPVWRKDPQAA
jgi:hypothetical protein